VPNHTPTSTATARNPQNNRPCARAFDAMGQQTNTGV
jgi:hypothetical protein